MLEINKVLKVSKRVYREKIKLALLVLTGSIYGFMLFFSGICSAVSYPKESFTPLTTDLSMNQYKLNDVGDIISKGPWVDVRAYASINAAVTAIGSTQATLLIPSAQTLTGNLTIPSTLSLEIINGGSIGLATYTLTINGSLDAGVYQVFSGSGTVAFGSGSIKEVYPEWWGATGDGTTNDFVALQATFDNVIASSHRPQITFSAKKYSYATGLSINPVSEVNGLNVKGVSGKWDANGNFGLTYGSYLYYTGTGTAVSFGDIAGAKVSRSIVWDGVSIVGTSSAANGLSVNIGASKFMNFEIQGFNGTNASGLLFSGISNVFENIGIIGNYIGMTVASNGETTINRFQGVSFNNNITKGVSQLIGSLITYDGCIFQGNGGNGLDIDGTVTLTGGLTKVLNSWFENNNKDYVGYQVSIKGPAADNRHTSPVITDSYFTSGGVFMTSHIYAANTEGFRLTNLVGAGSPGFTSFTNGGGNVNLLANTNLSYAGTEGLPIIISMSRDISTDRAYTEFKGTDLHVVNRKLSVIHSNEQAVFFYYATELTTIAAAAATDTVIDIPANTIVLGVDVRVIVAIPTAATFTVTGASSGTTFNTVAVSTAAGSTNKGNLNCPYNNGTAQKVRITPSATPAGATGQVRITVHYMDITPATS